MTPPIKSFELAPFRFLRTIFIRWLTGLFSSFPEGQYKYIENSPSSEISIYGAAPIKLDVNENRPCIVFQRLPSHWNNPGFGAGPLVQDTKLGSGQQRKTSLVSGILAFHCCSRVPDEAENLAWLVSFWLAECMPLLTRLRLHNIGQPSVQQVSPAPDALVETSEIEWSVCPVTLPFSFQYSWDSEAKHRTLKNIMASIETGLDEMEQEVTIRRDG